MGTAQRDARPTGRTADRGEPLLEVRDVEFAYGPLQVLFGASLEVGLGEQVALLGTNGAGKTTLLEVISGTLRASHGTIRFKGEDIGRLPPEQRVARGLVQMPGGRATFPSLTVLENLRMGAFPVLRNKPLVDQRLEEVLDLFPQLRPRLGQTGGTLSGGEQQMMALGRALLAGPELLMIDELSLGLAPGVLKEILGRVEELVRRGTTILLVEQTFSIALSIAQRAYFMERGKVVFSGATADLLERDDLAQLVLAGGGQLPTSEGNGR